MSPVNETLLIQVSKDGMLATGKFIPPTDGGTLLTKSEIIRLLSIEKIKFGILEHNIDNYLNDRSNTNTIILAQGKSVIQGKNAKITYHFHEIKDRKPQIREDGSVDFHQLNTITKVEKGQLLATLEREVEGIPGMDVRGKVLRPAKVRKLLLKPGKNLILSEDGLRLSSAVSGHVSFVDGTVFVSDLYELNEDVGPATGDIHFDGHVKINGNVLTGYTVRATGDIYVEGIVEGAIMEAGGNIVLSKGIQGVNKANISCGGDLMVKFIENVFIMAGRNVISEAILHSQVCAKETVTVLGKRGLIVGSQITAGQDIFAKVAGSTMGTATSLEIKVQDEIIKEQKRLQSLANEKQEELMKIQKVLIEFRERLQKGESVSNEQAEKFRILYQSYLKLEQNYNAMLDQIKRYSDQIEAAVKGTIRIERIIYPGVKLTIHKATTFNRKETKYSTFYQDGADIQVRALF